MENRLPITAVSKFKPNDSQASAQKFLIHILENIREGTLGGDIPLNLTKEDLNAKFGIKDEEIITASYNSSFFDRNGYRYFLIKNDGKEYLLVIGVQFKLLTKEQIFEVFGNKPYVDSQRYHQIIYKIGEYSVMFSNTDENNRDSYNFIMLSPQSPNFK